MKKTRSTTLRRAWPSSDFSDRASDRMRSRSEKDYRLHKRFPTAFAPQASRGYMTSGWYPRGRPRAGPAGRARCAAAAVLARVAGR